MILTKSEIKTLLADCLNIRYLRTDLLTGHPEDAVICGIEVAAEVIAAHLTPAHLMSHFVWQSIFTKGYERYIVTEPGGGRFRVDTRSLGLQCCPIFNTQTPCENDKRCYHVEAVKLHLARQPDTTLDALSDKPNF